MNYNIITEYFNFSKTCVNNYLKKILGKQYDRDIADKYLKVYFDSRYFGKYSKENENFSESVKNNLNYVYKLHERRDLDKKMYYAIKAFDFIYYFDNVIECESINQIIDEVEIFRKEELGFNKNKKFNSDLFNMVKEDLIKKKEYLDTINSEKFNFDYDATNLENVYEIRINQNLKFPVVYNSVMIDKVFNSADLSQRKATIEFSFSALRVLRDIIKGIFNFEYLVQYPSGISNKKTLHKNLFSILDNDILKDRIVIKIDYSDFLKEKESIYERMRAGYKFAVILDSSFKEEEGTVALLTVFKYIIVSPNNKLMFIDNYRNVIYTEKR